MRRKNSNLIFGLIIVSLIFVSLMGLVLAHGGESTSSYDGNMMSGVYGDMGGMGFLGWILVIVVIIALVLFIVWMIKNLKENKK